MGEQSVELVKGTYEAFGRGDVPAVLGAMAADIAWHEAAGMPYGGVYHGGDAVAQNVFGPISQDVVGFAVTPEEFIASGDAAGRTFSQLNRTIGRDGLSVCYPANVAHRHLLTGRRAPRHRR